MLLNNRVLFIFLFLNFLTIVSLHIFDDSKYKKKVIDERHLGFFLRKNLLYFINIFLVIYLLVLSYFFYNVAIYYDAKIVFEFFIFKLSFFIDYLSIFFLLINFLIFNFLVYYFYFYQKVLDYSLINFKVLAFIFSINMFIFISIISNNVAIDYICANFIQLYFYKLLSFLRNDNKLSNNMSIKNYQLVIIFLGDFLVIFSLFYMLYFYGTLDFTDLKSKLFSEEANSSIINVVFNKGHIYEFNLSFYWISIIYIILIFGIFFKSIYIYFWKYYIVLNKLSMNVFLIGVLYAILINISNSLFLYKCEKSFYLFFLYRQFGIETGDNIFNYTLFNILFDFTFVDLLLIAIWCIRLFFLFYYRFIKN